MQFAWVSPASHVPFGTPPTQPVMLLLPLPLPLPSPPSTQARHEFASRPGGQVAGVRMQPKQTFGSVGHIALPLPEPLPLPAQSVGHDAAVSPDSHTVLPQTAWLLPPPPQS